jgi:iron-sulfur cluster repair protein YtfE (RIC family)
LLLSIGKKQQSEELVDLLLGCHGRIRTFLALAIAIGERADAPDGDVADAATRVRRYFSEALPLHVEDEEQGVLPRLHGRSVELDAALDRMCEEHDLHGEPLRRLLGLCSALAASPGDASARAAVAATAQELVALLEPHLAAEESVLFPAIRTLLDAEEQRAVVGELRARRQPP